MTNPSISWSRALEMAKQGYDAWAAKPHNKKWVRRIDGTPIQNDMLVNIATAICEHMPETPMDERQARIYRLERRIHCQRQALRENWEIIEMRCKNWMGSQEARRRYIDLVKRHQKMIHEARPSAARPPLWRRLINAIQ